MRMLKDDEPGCDCQSCRNWKEQVLYLVNLSAIHPQPRLRDRLFELRRELWVHGNSEVVEMPYCLDARAVDERPIDA